ncbi:alpha/beta hydrolase [Ramlibacter algicola]|uniref:Alpha/beta hydrolase n=1 Tax=Ramlibacter algicola TaxID=2795217 RepID=A0A934PZR3_9BURK|nr:alpha/beta hydrolase [Ramlibacter algicola]MBK0392383.1 alpha/beta hydrolase [Ramlibacter algicola]
MSKYKDDADDKRPNPVVDTLSHAVAAMRADADQKELAACHEAMDPKAIEKLSAAEARRQPTPADAVMAMLRKHGRPTDMQALVPGVSSNEIEVAGAAGRLPATVYRPAGDGPFGVILYFHGGGWVIADRHVYDGGARGLCAQADAIVVSVDYRQAPEHKFPAQWDDALAAYRWVLDNAARLGGDPGRIALAGESAGGNLSVATAMLARDAGLPLPQHVLSVYPIAQPSLSTESYLENAIAKPLNRAMMQWFFDQVARTEDDLQDPRINLVDAPLRGLPPVTIVNARLDPLRSDGARLEDALRKAGVPVERREYEGVAHEFFGAAAVLEKARQAQAFAGERLRGALGG